MSLDKGKKGVELSLSKLVKILIMSIVIVTVTFYSPKISGLVSDSLYKSTVENCELEGETGFNTGDYCHPVNCDENSCDEEEEDRWERLLEGFKESQCYEDRDECETDFEKRMYDQVQKEEDLTVPEDFSPNKFRSKTEEVADNLGADSDDLLAVMHFETAGTFDPCVGNHQSGATGLIQFTQGTLDDMGVSKERLCEMSAVEQLDHVEDDLEGVKETYDGADYSSLEDLYMAVLCPNSLETGIVATDLDDDNVEEEGACDLESNTVYEQNSGLDRDDDGVITSEEAVESVEERLELVKEYDWDSN